MIEALLLAIAQPQPGTEPEPAEIIVTGMRKGRCRVRMAQRTLSDREFAAHAREWGALGRPVSVVRPAGATHRCLARIVFRLHDHGVRLVHFRDAAEDAPAAADR